MDNNIYILIELCRGGSMSELPSTNVVNTSRPVRACIYSHQAQQVCACGLVLIQAKRRINGVLPFIDQNQITELCVCARARRIFFVFNQPSVVCHGPVPIAIHTVCPLVCYREARLILRLMALCARVALGIFQINPYCIITCLHACTLVLDLIEGPGPDDKCAHYGPIPI